LYPERTSTTNYTISTDAKLNLYLFLGKLSIDTECSGLGARKYKNNCAQALTSSQVPAVDTGCGAAFRGVD
jgi:hypothetical protein